MHILNKTRRTVVAGIFAAIISFAFAIPANADGESAVLVLTQKAGDQGPNDSMIAGLAKAEEKFNLETRVIEALDPATHENTLRTLARRGTDVIVTTFFGMGATVATVAPEFPDTKFVVIVAAPHDPVIPNVRTTLYTTQENTYLAGIFGATMSETGKLGLIGGVPLPFVFAEYNAMLSAAKSVNPDSELTIAFTQSFEDPVKGKEVAASLYDSGIDTIFSGASGADVGVVEAAGEKDRTVMVPAPALIAGAPKNVGFVPSFEWSQTVVLEIENALSDDFQAGGRFGGIRSGEIIMTFSEDYANANPKAAEARKATEAVYEKIKAGELTIPYDETEPK